MYNIYISLSTFDIQRSLEPEEHGQPLAWVRLKYSFILLRETGNHLTYSPIKCSLSKPYIIIVEHDHWNNLFEQERLTFVI